MVALQSPKNTASGGGGGRSCCRLAWRDQSISPPPPAPPCSRKHIGRIRVSHTRLHQGNLRLDGVEKAHTFYHHTQLGVGGGGEGGINACWSVLGIQKNCLDPPCITECGQKEENKSIGEMPAAQQRLQVLHRYKVNGKTETEQEKWRSGSKGRQCLIYGEKLREPRLVPAERTGR